MKSVYEYSWAFMSFIHSCVHTFMRVSHSSIAYIRFCVIHPAYQYLSLINYWYPRLACPSSSQSHYIFQYLFLWDIKKIWYYGILTINMDDMSIMRNKNLNNQYFFSILEVHHIHIPCHTTSPPDYPSKMQFISPGQTQWQLMAKLRTK